MFREFNHEDVFENVINQELVLIDFSATWCGPCRMLKPELEEVANEDSSLNVYSIDVDDFPQIAAKFNVRSIPTLLFFKKGKLLHTSIGYIDKASIRRMIDNLEEE